MDEEYVSNFQLLVDTCNMMSKLDEQEPAETGNQQNVIETINYKLEVPHQSLKRSRQKFSNHNLESFYEDASDELTKRFSYKCKFSPTTCSKIAKSYGSECEALAKIRKHVLQHINGESSAVIPESSRDSSKRPFQETVPQRGFNSEKPARKDATEEAMLKFGQCEHDYAKRGDEPLPNDEAEPKKRQRRKVTTAYEKMASDLVDRCVKGQSYTPPPHVSTAPFPFVHHPEPLEPAAVVEFYSNGNPVDVARPAFVNNLDLAFSVLKKQVKNFVNKKKSKFAQAASGSRSVLECVENRVACMPNASSAVVPHKGIENSENLVAIAVRNIALLTQQKKKRSGRARPSVYACEICNKHFTANTSLIYHYMGHLNIKPFQCQECFKTFTRRHSLKYHTMIHENKNRFQCSICNKQFRHPSHYKDHLKKHTGEQPYSCKFCSNNFKSRNTYKRHLKMQHPNDIVPILNN